MKAGQGRHPFLVLSWVPAAMSRYQFVSPKTQSYNTIAPLNRDQENQEQLRRTGCLDLTMGAGIEK